jgi:hypothetical protein
MENSKGLDAMAVSTECEAAEELHRRLYAASPNSAPRWLTRPLTVKISKNVFLVLTNPA